MIEKLRLYNQWRRGADIPQPDPTEIGELLDTVANRLEVLEREHEEFFENWHDERRKREFLELRLEEIAENLASIPDERERRKLLELKTGDLSDALKSRREIMAENGDRELAEVEPGRMKIKAFQAKDKIRVIATGQIGRIHRAGMVDGRVKYYVMGREPEGFSGWFSGWEIERV